MIELNPEVGFFIDIVVCEATCSILGRCGDAAIQVGDVFDAVFHYKSRRTMAELAYPGIRDAAKSVSIRVVGVEAYQRSLDCLGEGMTGSLVVEGEGLEHLAPDWILGYKSEPTNGGVHEAAPAQLATSP